MKVFIITCQFATAARRDAVLNAIKARASWIQLLDMVYLVATEETAGQLYDALAHHTGQEDSVYVLPVSHPYRGFGQRPVNQWLDQTLSSAGAA